MDRDFFEDTVTSEHRVFTEAPHEPIDDPPPFLAMGTAVEGLDDRAEDLEATQPMPRMTMAELVFEPARAVVEVKARAVGTTPPPSRPAGPLGALDLARFADGVDRIDLLFAAATAKAADVDQIDLPAEVPATSRKIRPRRTRPRARTIAPRRLTSVELRQVASTATAQADRPRTRAECAHEQRPCPWVSCKHHLYLDVNPRTGTIKLNFPDLEPWELEHTCALDVADAGGHTLEEVGDITNLTRERIRQLELRGLLELRGRSRNLR
jgi:hypothetical protein